MRGSVNDIARSIFAPRERDEAATSSYVATAVTDSSDGTVTVSVSGQVVEVRTTSDVRAGDSVLVQASRHRLTATGAVGGGDRTQAEVRAASEDAARARADAAEALAHAGGGAATVRATCRTPAATAAKVADVDGQAPALAAGLVAYVAFADSNTVASPTLDVGGTGARPMMTNGAPYAYFAGGTVLTLLYDGSRWQVCSTPVYASEATVGNPAAANVRVGADSVDVRDGTAVLASFGERLVELGRGATDAVVRMCGGRAWVSYDDASGAASLRGASAVLVGAPRLAELSAQGAGAGRYAHAVCDDSDGTAGVLLAAGDGAGHTASLALNGSEGTADLAAADGLSVNSVQVAPEGWRELAAGRAWYARAGGHVVVQLLNVSAGGALGTLPEGYRPTRQIRDGGDAAVGFVLDGTHVGYAYCNVDGGVRTYLPASGEYTGQLVVPLG